MFERERKLYAFNLGLLNRLLTDVSDEEFDTRPIPTANPPRWILGHLAVVTDSCLHLLGQRPALPKEWRRAFSPGSRPDQEGAPSPSKSELLSAISEGHARVLAALDEANEAWLAEPHGVAFESFELLFPTRGELLANMMSNHESFHIGQLSAWRRAVGRPYLF